MTASIIPFRNVGGPSSPTSTERPVTAPASQATGRTSSPSETIDDPVSNRSDRLKASAVARMDGQAMIAHSVRNTRLIALPIHSSPSLSDKGSVIPLHGMREDEPRYAYRRTGHWRGSAKARPQSCGKVQARFHPAGLAEWLRQTFPQSTAQHIEAATGIAAATAENWLLRRSQPSVEHFVTLVGVFGPDLLQSCMGMSAEWVDRAVAEERAIEIDRQIEDLRRERAAIGRSA